MDACSRARSQKAQGTPLDLGDERFRARGKSPLAAEVSGFNVHAGVTVRAVDREGIGRLFRVTVGQGGFGSYLESENRETPDGRKPSAWENELLDGRGSSFGLGIDGAFASPSRPRARRGCNPTGASTTRRWSASMRMCSRPTMASAWPSASSSVA